MKLWKLESIGDRPEWQWPYDKNHGYVIRAKTQEDARQMAADRACDEGSAVWLNPESTMCEELKCEGEPEVCMTDFAAG